MEDKTARRIGVLLERVLELVTVSTSPSQLRWLKWAEMG
jgi:hypothetical protein